MRYWDLTYTSLNFSFYPFSCFRLSYDCFYILGPSCFSEALLIIIGFLGGYSSFILIFCGVVSCFADANGLFLLFDIVLVICSFNEYFYCVYGLIHSFCSLYSFEGWRKWIFCFLSIIFAWAYLYNFYSSSLILSFILMGDLIFLLWELLRCLRV